MSTRPVVIHGATPVEAWRSVMTRLLDEGNRFNIVVHIEDPLGYTHDELRALDPRSVLDKADSIFDVANTIFPDREKWDSSPNRFYEHYKKVYRRGKRRHKSAWGTYFQRLVAFGDDEINQLEKVIRPLNAWARRPRAALVVHLSSTDLDNPRPLGAPCWQYGQFTTSPPNKLSLVAAYRSHDYFNKALGNFVGLSRLLEYVCHRTGLTPGTLTCLSTYAFIDGPKKYAKALTQRGDV